jgi:hypothetical protein
LPWIKAAKNLGYFLNFPKTAQSKKAKIRPNLVTLFGNYLDIDIYALITLFDYFMYVAIRELTSALHIGSRTRQGLKIKRNEKNRK